MCDCTPSDVHGQTTVFPKYMTRAPSRVWRGILCRRCVRAGGRGSESSLAVLGALVTPAEFAALGNPETSDESIHGVSVLGAATQEYRLVDGVMVSSIAERDLSRATPGIVSLCPGIDGMRGQWSMPMAGVILSTYPPP